MSTVNKLIEIALLEEGYLEKKSNDELDNKTANVGHKNYTKYARDLDNLKDFYNGKKNGHSWCDVFVDWCFVKTFGRTRAQELLCQPNKSTGAGVGYSKNFYVKKNQYHKSNPQVGDQIFFKKGLSMTHTGIVYKVDDKKVYTIEGNTSSKQGVISNGGCVRTKSYNLNLSSIDGYGRPNYTSDELNDTTPKQETYYIDNVGYDGLNVRSKQTNEVIDNYPIGTQLKIEKISNGKAYFDNNYVYANYLSKQYPSLKTIISKNGLYVRQKRNTNNKKNPPITLLPYGTKVKLYGEKYGWTKVSPNKEAWVSSKYLK